MTLVPETGMQIKQNSQLPLYWLLFFLISLGLGYPVLNRFDPRLVRGCVSSNVYSRLVVGGPSDPTTDMFEIRVLVPWVARPFYWAAQGRVRTWDSVAFSLLISNSLFTATGALLLLIIGKRCPASSKAAFTGTLLYLLNFSLPNRQLGCSLVDSGEACLMLVLFRVLFEENFFLLPLVGLVGALAKESFVPMSVVAVLGWLLADFRHCTLKRILWWLGMTVIGLITVVYLLFHVTGTVILPWQHAHLLRAESASLLGGFWGNITDKYFWYVFGWLLPFSAIKLKRFPKTWIWSSLGGVAAALAMGAWNNAGANTVPSIFNSIGPLLSLSAAAFFEN